MRLASRNSLPVSDELIQRLGWLVRLRWLAVVGVLIFLEIARRTFSVTLGLRQLHVTLLTLALCNAGYSWWLARFRKTERPALPAGARRLALFLLPRAHGEPDDLDGAARAALFANLQVAVDLLLLAALLHFSGGVENPFLYFFIFHVIIASILFSRRATYVHAAWGVALVAVVAIGESAGVLRHYALGGAWSAGAYRDAAVVTAQLLVFALTLLLSAYMGGSIAARLRRREREVVALSREVARKADTLAAALERVCQAEQAKSQYMRKVAHELRGPLGTIRTSMSALLSGIAGDLPMPAREILRRVEARSTELAEVTADLLVLARAREGAAVVEIGPVDLVAVCRDVIEDVRGAGERLGVMIRLKTDGDVPTLSGDAPALRELVGNLMMNALRYTPHGGDVEIRVSRRGDSVELEVEDTGIGIPPGDLDRIFEEFYRAKNARSHSADGTGLGLAIVKAAAAQHGGRVSVRSELGRGTTFAVNLPVSVGEVRIPEEPAPV